MVVGVLAATVSGCGGGSKSPSSSTPAPTAQKSSKVAAEVPAAIKKKGTLKVAADATYAPNEFIGANGKTVEGMDADLATALGGVMGLGAQVVNATFDSIIPGLAAHKFDLGMSSFTELRAHARLRVEGALDLRAA
jgi:polar amino acid transport system substrate-binding protein